MSLRPVGGSITCDASTAIVSHALRLPLGVEAQGWPEIRATATPTRSRSAAAVLRRSLGP